MLFSQESVIKLFTEHIEVKSGSKCLHTDVFRQLIKSDEDLHRVVEKYAGTIRKRFNVYAGANIDMECRDDASVDLMELEMLFKDFGVNCPNVTKRAVFGLFTMSRDENLLEDSYALRYASFLELLLRVACLKYGGPDCAMGQTPVHDPDKPCTPLHECAAQLFDIICAKKR